jgi:4-amino-4-deoxy-L-arabinose transferase-like glycosyltransferase
VAPRAWLAACALALGALCWGIGSYPLLEPDEGRNVEVAREMARGGDYVLPHLDGLPYLDKPATYFAAVAFSLRAFGDGEGAARLPSLLFTLGTVVLVWRLGRRLGPPGTGELAALSLATMPLVLAFSRTVIFDAALAFLETLALAAAWRGFSEERQAHAWFGLAWAAMGLGAITKGPVAVVVPLLVLTAFGFGAGVRLRPLFALRAWPWFFVTALPWFVAVSLRRPDFPGYAFVYESLKRVATRSAGRSGPWWYFLPVLLAGSFPWIGPAAAAGVRAWRLRAGRRRAEGRAAVFVASWALVPLLFFSLSRSKLPGYYLPALPAVALAAAMLMARATGDDGAWRGVRIGALAVTGLTALLATALVAFSDTVFRPVPLSPLVRNALPGVVFGLGAALTGGAILAFLAVRRRSVWLLSVGLALPVIGTPFAGRGFLAALAADRSSRDLAASIESAAPGARVIGVEAYPTSLRYYLDRPVLLASGSAAELTSNYIVSRAAEFRALPDSPLRPAGWWRDALAACATPTVFVARRGRAPAEELARTLPFIAAGGADANFLAFGPCRPAGPGGAPPSGTAAPPEGPR